MFHILSDHETYSTLSYDPINRSKRELKGIVKQGFHDCILDKKENIYFVPLALRIPTIYYLPKIHKSLTKPPARPIISGIDLF